jgi:hypothetical protein
MRGGEEKLTSEFVPHNTQSPRHTKQKWYEPSRSDGAMCWRPMLCDEKKPSCKSFALL